MRVLVRGLLVLAVLAVLGGVAWFLHDRAMDEAARGHEAELSAVRQEAEKARLTEDEVEACRELIVFAEKFSSSVAKSRQAGGELVELVGEAYESGLRDGGRAFVSDPQLDSRLERLRDDLEQAYQDTGDLQAYLNVQRRCSDAINNR